MDEPKRKYTHREFLKLCGVAVVGAGATQLVVPPRPAYADQTITGTLTVTGGLIVGSASEVATGAIKANANIETTGGVFKAGSRTVADSSGCYYA